MKEFDINEIKIEDKNKPSLSELLTGSVVKGLDPNSPIKDNAEIERGEFIKFPDNETVEVVGQKHKTGGVKMNIPDGTKVISDHLKLKPDQVKKLKLDYGLDVSTSDTYAKAMKRYVKKIGLFKLNAEQKDLFDELDKVLNKGKDNNTTNVNKQYLNNKIFTIEQKKKNKQKDQQKFFDVLFEMQEKTKPKNERAEGFKNGGKSMKNFEAVCKQLGITPKQAEKILKNGGLFEDGGTQLTEAEKKEIKEKWNGNQEAYMKFKKTKSEILKNKDFQKDLYEQYKKDIEDPKNFTKRRKDAWHSALKDRSPEEVVDYLIKGEEANARLAAFNLDPKTTSQATAKGQRTNKEIVDLIEKTPGLKDIKDVFQRGHVFQAGYIAYDNLMKTDKYKDYRIQQTGVGDEAKGTISGIDADWTNTTAGQRLNFNLGEEPKKEEPKKEEPKKEDTRDIGAEGELEDTMKYAPKNNMPRLFFQPDQSALPPTPMEAHLKGKVRLQRIDPVRIGIEQNLQEIADQRQFVASQLEEIPDSQKASALASLLATSQKSANQAITAANITNAQNISQAELFNIQQAGQEEVYDLNNALNFEQRQMTAKAKTDEELRRYYDYNRKVNISNFQNQQKLNLLDSLFPDFDLDFMGASVSYNPQGAYDPKAAARMQELSTYLQYAQMNPQTPNVTETE